MSFAKAQDLLKLAMMATRRSGVALEDIAEEFACSYRTAQRMIEALESAFPQTTCHAARSKMASVTEQGEWYYLCSPLGDLNAWDAPSCHLFADASCRVTGNRESCLRWYDNGAVRFCAEPGESINELTCDAEVPGQTAFFTATRTVVETAPDESQCLAFGNNADCTLEAEICTDSDLQTRVIGGVSVTRPCWAWERSYSCTSKSPASDCSDLENQSTCRFVREECLTEEEPCETWERVYECALPASGTQAQYVCDGDVYCIDGSCETIERTANNEFRDAVKTLGLFGDDLDRLANRGKAIGQLLEGTQPEWLPDLFAALVHQVEIAEETVSITFRSLELRRLMAWDGKTAFRGRPADWPCSDARYVLDVDVRVITAERWPSLHITPRTEVSDTRPNPKLVELIKAARRAQILVDEHRDLSIEELAKRQGCRPTHFARLIRLNYLAPDIATSILDGTQPAGLDRKTLLDSNVPTSWAVQRKLFGFPAPERAISPRNLFGRGMWPAAGQTDDDGAETHVRNGASRP